MTWFQKEIKNWLNIDSNQFFLNFSGTGTKIIYIINYQRSNLVAGFPFILNFFRKKKKLGKFAAWKNGTQKILKSVYWKILIHSKIESCPINNPFGQSTNLDNAKIVYTESEKNTTHTF